MLSYFLTTPTKYKDDHDEVVRSVTAKKTDPSQQVKMKLNSEMNTIGWFTTNSSEIDPTVRSEIEQIHNQSAKV